MAMNLASKYMVRIDERFDGEQAGSDSDPWEPPEYSSMTAFYCLNYILLAAIFALPLCVVLAI